MYGFMTDARVGFTRKTNEIAAATEGGPGRFHPEFSSM